MPIGEFSSTNPSVAEEEMTGGALSTGLTFTKSLAVENLFFNDCSSAYNTTKNTMAVL